MQISRTVTVIELAWIAIAAFGLFYGLLLRSDARKDVAARKLAGVNSGREELAALLVVTSTLTTYAFLGFLLAGLLAATVPSRAVTPLAVYVLQAFLISGQASLAVMVWHKQRVRRRVFNRDMADRELRRTAESVLATAEAKRLATAAELIAERQEHNTAALEANTIATEAATEAMENGGLSAQIDATRAMDANTASRVSDAAALLVAAANLATEHDENTEALNLNTSATDRNTDHRDQNQRTRKTDEEPHE